jgi:hypothetical protein
MTAPFFPPRAVEDAALALIAAADRLAHTRQESDRIAAALEQRWAANRTARRVAGID